MNVHKNARLTVHGRLLLVQRVCRLGWRVVEAAAAGSVSERTAYTWLARYRDGGEPALHDRSSAPACSPGRLSADAIATIERLRRQRWSGPRWTTSSPIGTAAPSSSTAGPASRPWVSPATS